MIFSKTFKNLNDFKPTQYSDTKIKKLLAQQGSQKKIMLNVLPCKVKIAKSLMLPFLRYQLDYTSTSFFLHYIYLPLTVFKFLLAYKTKFFLFLAHLAKRISPVFIISILQRLLKQRLSPSFDCARCISLRQRVVLKWYRFPSSLRPKTRRTFWSIKPLKAFSLRCSSV